MIAASKEWRRAVRHARWQRWAAVRAGLCTALLQGALAGMLVVGLYLIGVFR